MTNRVNAETNKKGNVSDGWANNLSSSVIHAQMETPTSAAQQLLGWQSHDTVTVLIEKKYS
jgi:hypothetical protein